MMSDLKGLSRREFLALTGATAAHAALYAAPTPPAPPRAGALSLAGEWRFALDRDDRGLKEEWFSQELSGGHTISLPGILQTQGYGDDISVETPWVAALPRDMRWWLVPEYAPYTKSGPVEMPYLTQPVKHYIGVAWYEREINIPPAWNGKRVALTLERTRWQTSVYVDGKPVGECHSLVAPHEFELGLLAAGRHRLSIRIDNRMLLPYRPDGHSVADHEGGTWTGVVGRIELTATSPVWIDDAQVFPNVGEKRARVKVKIGNATGKSGSGSVSAGTANASPVRVPVSWDANGGEAELDVPLPNATPWSEFTPVLQKLTVRLTGEGADSDDRREVTFGLREIKADGRHILLNGELFNFRATHDGGGFPLTGYPATDLATWKRIISTCKEWGLNGIRFHSWCPPEAAFIAGDELGFYFQPECGMWNSFDPEGKMLAVLNDETTRLIKAYGNHPSLLLLNATNEPAGHYAEQLPTWDKKWREADSRRLYSDGTGRWAPPPAGPGTPFAADYLVTGGARGPRGWFGADYEETLDQILRGSFGRQAAQGSATGTRPPIAPTPCIGHEVGQWCAYPDFDVIAKFSEPKGRVKFPAGIGTGKTPYMVPGNYRIWRDFAEKNHLLGKNRAMAHASGRFQVACFKEEIEANLRTPGYSGYELLDLHDYLGQGGALIGMLDAFWESKGYVEPAEFRQYCNATVPLARLKDRVFSSAATLTVDVEAAHYGPKAIGRATSRWQIVAKDGKVVAGGSWEPKPIPRGKNIALGTIEAELAKLPAPAEYRLAVELNGGTAFRNEWKFWVYPAAVDESTPGEVLVTRSWAEAETRLTAGGRVLFLPEPASLANSPKVSTVPIFWNHLMNPGGTTFLGLLVDQHHPALSGFPTETNCDWQWVDLFADTHALDLTTMPAELNPIVQSIDDWNRGLKLALVYECRVGAGSLMVSSLNLTGAGSARPGMPSLRRSVLEYMASAKFRPATAVPAEVLRAQYANPHAAPATPAEPNQPSTPDLVDPGQIRRKPGA